MEDDGVALDLQATFQLTMVVCALDEVCSNGEKLIGISSELVVNATHKITTFKSSH